jgi:hypothetical protein
MSKIESILAAALAPVLAQMQAQQAELLALRQGERSVPSGRSGRPRGAVYGEGLVFPGEHLPRMVYQDRLFQENAKGWVSVGSDGERKTVRLTDTQLLTLNHVEHPTCTGRMDLFIVRHMRRVFNAGTHSPAQTVPPRVPSVEYLADGTPTGEFATLYTRTLALVKAEARVASAA